MKRFDFGPRVTPLVPFLMAGGQRVFVKVESQQRTGSIKGRTALGLLASASAAGRLRPGATIVESSSGNMGVALAEFCGDLGLGCHLVVDGKLPRRLQRRMHRAGAVMSSIPDSTDRSRMLDARLDLVRELSQRPGSVWLDQYSNPAAQAVHFATTGPEILQQMDRAVGGLDVVVAPISTGGTLSGIGRFMRSCAPQVRVVAADSVGSAIFGGHPGRRWLNGIGASVRPANVDLSAIDEHFDVADDEAISSCWEAASRLEGGVGGSTGAALVAASRLLAAAPSLRIAVVSPDGAESYANTLFDQGWLRARSLHVPLTPKK